MHNLIKIICPLWIMLGSFNLMAQLDDLPTVFMIGENEGQYEQLFISCNERLLSVCDNSMDEAYQNWSTMLSDVEQYAEDTNFDLRGIKIWVNVFWNNDGTVKNIVYYPKPNSRNMNFEELTSFFMGFAAGYQLDVSAEKCFSHYGSASFPTFNKFLSADDR